jgi:predicted PurR-regulated permease PerM
VLAEITLFLNQQATGLARGIPAAVQGLLSTVEVILGIIMIAAVMPVVHFYLLKDYPHIKPRLVELFPTFGGRRDYLVRAGSVVGQFLRGQILISAIAAFNVSVALIILDVPFALLIGIIGGVLNMIPNLGIIITYVIGILIAIIFGDPWFLDVVKVAAVLMAEQLLEASVLTPKILSYHVGLHPVLIVLALFVFGYFMGLIGLLIAVPVTALAMAVYKSYRDQMTFELTMEEDAPAET